MSVLRRSGEPGDLDRAAGTPWRGSLIRVASTWRALLTSDEQPNLVCTIGMPAANAAPPAALRDGIIMLAGLSPELGIVVGRWLALRCSQEALAELRASGTYGALPADHPDTAWALERLTR